MTDTQRHIRNRVARLAKARKNAKRQPQKKKSRPVLRAQEVSIPDKEKPQFFGVFLVTCIFLLFIATMAMMVADGDFALFQSDVVASEEVQQEPEQEQEAVVTPPVVPPQNDRRHDQLDARVAQLEKDVKVYEHRVWLLGLATNENATLSKRMDKDHHRIDQRGFITFDKDWKLSRVPETMKLTPEQEQRIRNGPNPK